MNKIFVLSLILLASAAAAGADLTTESGKVYKNVELVKAAAGSVVIEHDKGTATIALNDLPDDFLAALNSRQRIALQTLADIKLKNGKILRKCVIDDSGDNQVQITHLRGSVKVKFSDLPDKYQAIFTRRQLEMLKKPFTGKKGSKKQAAYQDSGKRTEDGKIIYIGARGGKFYFNDFGKKVYLK